MTTPLPEPGERRPQLDRPPGDRYRKPSDTVAAERSGRRLDAALIPIGLLLGGAIGFVVLGGVLEVTAGLAVVAAFLGWLTGRLVSPPIRAAAIGLLIVVVGFLGIWAFGRIEGGVLDPLGYLWEVEGPVVVALSLIGCGGLAAAASR